MPDREKVITEIEDALSGNLAKVGHLYRMSLNELKDKTLKDALALLKEQPEIVRCKDCKYMEDDGSISPLIWCSIHEFGRMKDYFCADAIRKDNGHMIIIDKNVENQIKQEIEKLKQINAAMIQQTEQEINKNNLHIFALEQLLERKQSL